MKKKSRHQKGYRYWAFRCEDGILTIYAKPKQLIELLGFTNKMLEDTRRIRQPSDHVDIDCSTTKFDRLFKPMKLGE